MVETKLFKTRLCVLYEKGSCPRHTCSFAHGDAELRRFSGSGSGSFNGRRDFRGSDLRDRLDRRHSPQRKYSPERDVRGRQEVRGREQLHHDRGHSTSRSPSRSDKRQRKKHRFNGQSDVSGSFKLSSGIDGLKDRKMMSSSARDELEEKLKKAQLDVDLLENHKSQLEIHLDKKAKESEGLLSRIEELETQLNKEQEDCKRINSTIKKVIRVHSRYSKAKEELKRSEARLHKLGDQLAISTSRPNANEEDSSFNNVSDREPNDENVKSYINARETNPSLRKKKHRISHEAGKEMKTGDLRKHLVGISVPEKLTKVDMFAVHSDKNSKEANHADRTLARSNGPRSAAYEENNNSQRKNTSHSTEHIKKVKCLEPAHALPPTCMAAHAVDELIEVVEVENSEMMGATATGIEKNTTKERRRFSYLPPPPPLPVGRGIAYKQYEDEDVDIDVEEVGTEVRDSGLNDEVDIEQL